MGGIGEGVDGKVMRLVAWFSRCDILRMGDVRDYKGSHGSCGEKEKDGHGIEEGPTA